MIRLVAGWHEVLTQERPFGTYLRQFSLGEGVDPERISAHYDNGVVSVIILLGEKAKPRKIAIESSNASTDQPTISV